MAKVKNQSVINLSVHPVFISAQMVVGAMLLESLRLLFALSLRNSPLKKAQKEAPWQNNDIVATSLCVFFLKSYIRFLGFETLVYLAFFS